MQEYICMITPELRGYVRTAQQFWEQQKIKRYALIAIVMVVYIFAGTFQDMGAILTVLLVAVSLITGEGLRFFGEVSFVSFLANQLFIILPFFILFYGMKGISSVESPRVRSVLYSVSTAFILAVFFPILKPIKFIVAAWGCAGQYPLVESGVGEIDPGVIPCGWRDLSIFGDILAVSILLTLSVIIGTFFALRRRKRINNKL